MDIRIATERVRLGMHVTGMDCGWMDSSFWRLQSLLDRQADLLVSRDAGARHVTIGPAKGLVPALDRSAPGPAALDEGAAVGRRTCGHPTTTPHDEIDRARYDVGCERRPFRFGSAWQVVQTAVRRGKTPHAALVPRMQAVG